jgi:hypothetical protein
MNERIKDLAFRAGFIGESMNPIIGTSQVTALENFAELIVRECAGIDFRHKVGLTHDDDYAISKVIRGHFGVE